MRKAGLRFGPQLRNDALGKNLTKFNTLLIENAILAEKLTPETLGKLVAL